MRTGAALLMTAAGLAFGLALGFGLWGQKKPVTPPEPTPRDTVKVVQTITQIRPEIRYIRVIDTMTVAVVIRDTLLMHDTLLVQLPRQQAVFSDDTTYRAVVSGYQPSLDTMTVWPTTVYIHDIYPNRRPLIVPTFSAGYGIAFPAQDPPVAAPWVGAGIGVDLGEAWRRIFAQ